jgi:hypothetical protein
MQVRHKRVFNAHVAVSTTAMLRAATASGLLPYEVETLEEHAFLHMFCSWEELLEAVFCSDLCGSHFVASPNPTTFKVGVSPSTSVTAARSRLMADESWNFLLWHNPSRAARCWRLYFQSSNSERVINSARSFLEAAASIRHHIAHRSSGTRAEMTSKVAAGFGVNIGSMRTAQFLTRTASSNAILAIPPSLGVGPSWFEVIAHLLDGLAGQLAP